MLKRWDKLRYRAHSDDLQLHQHKHRIYEYSETKGLIKTIIFDCKGEGLSLKAAESSNYLG